MPSREELLEQALKEVMEWLDAYSPGFMEDDEWPGTEERVKEALR